MGGVLLLLLLWTYDHIIRKKKGFTLEVEGNLKSETPACEITHGLYHTYRTGPPTNCSSELTHSPWGIVSVGL